MSAKLPRKKELIYRLSEKQIKRISIYFCILLIISLTLSIFTLLNPVKAEDNIMLFTIITSVSVAIMLSCIKYLRKIYKACIDKRTEVLDQTTWYESWGNILYFILRPFYSAVFVVLMIFAMLAGFVFVTFSIDEVLNIRFLYFCTTISGIIGYSTGRLLDAFEIFSDKKVDKFFKNRSD